MRPENWDGDTTVIDPGFYAIEVPVMDGGTRLCPEGTCKHRFRESDSTTRIISHIVQKHGTTMSVERTCPVCGESFSIQRDQHDKEYCSRECYYRRDEGTMLDITNDIRDELGVDGAERYLGRETRIRIREELT